MDRKYATYLDEHINLFGDLVAAKFPSSSHEITEAGKCLAVRRATACVAHLMRALEPALNSLATALDVPFAHSNWQNILDQIEKEIRKRANALHGPTWKADEQFYSEAAAHFRVLKDAWRNHTMHLRDRYDEERAETILQSVRGLCSTWLRGFLSCLRSRRGRSRRCGSTHRAARGALRRSG